jgi:hypothetical protein
MDNDKLTGNPYPEEPALAPFEAYETGPPELCQLCLDPSCYGH